MECPEDEVLRQVLSESVQEEVETGRQRKRGQIADGKRCER